MILYRFGYIICGNINIKPFAFISIGAKIWRGRDLFSMGGRVEGGWGGEVFANVHALSSATLKLSLDMKFLKHQRSSLENYYFTVTI